MGLLDRILGRKAELETEAVTADVPIGDARAIDRYERMLRTAPREVIERAHVEAFEQLTPAQLDVLFERFSATAAADDERPSDARPASLARSAAQAEHHRPGAITRTLEDTQTRAGTNALVGASILDAVVWYSIASVAWSTWSVPDDASAASSDAFDAGGFYDLGF
ncbi:hypothetical protein [Agromyces humatus]|uniref:DUF1707 domain-containing protein n=1 Tax=Agromyces humatus TaxID=279573 RepID=A0ABP4WPY5_9MICO|nr:hypothetical protein [Agromyces humatus]